MELPKNRFKRAIAEGQLQIGLWSQLANPYATEVLADAGFDFVVVDAEHAPNDVLSVAPQLQILDRSPASAVVRPPWNDMVLIKRYLDVGAQTLLVPYVQSAEEAALAVSYLRYPPAGLRGVAGCHRGNRFGRVEDYFAQAASELCLVVQVETVDALDRLEAIAAVEGVDGIFIGPADLAASMGQIGNLDHPDVRAAIEAVPTRLQGLGKPAGILSSLEADVRRHIEAGFLFVAVGSDLALLAKQTAALAARFR